MRTIPAIDTYSMPSPISAGYDHRKNASSINLNAVRLCFQVFLPTADPKEVKRLKPVVSETIYDASK